jgi:hypothetical protein
LHLTLLYYSCKHLLLILLASSSSRSLTQLLRTTLRTQPKPFSLNQQPSLRFRNDYPPPPPAQQAPTPIGCLIFKELRLSAAPQAAEKGDYMGPSLVCKALVHFFFPICDKSFA